MDTSGCECNGGNKKEIFAAIVEEFRERQRAEDERPPPPNCIEGQVHRFRRFMYRSLDGRPQEVRCDYCGVITRNANGYEEVPWNAPGNPFDGDDDD